MLTPVSFPLVPLSTRVLPSDPLSWMPPSLLFLLCSSFSLSLPVGFQGHLPCPPARAHLPWKGPRLLPEIFSLFKNFPSPPTIPGCCSMGYSPWPLSWVPQISPSSHTSERSTSGCRREGRRWNLLQPFSAVEKEDFMLLHSNPTEMVWVTLGNSQAMQQ